MVLGMLFENFKNVHILRYVIYEFFKKVLGGPRLTCLFRVHCAGVEQSDASASNKENGILLVIQGVSNKEG